MMNLFWLNPYKTTKKTYEDVHKEGITIAAESSWAEENKFIDRFIDLVSNEKNGKIPTVFEVGSFRGKDTLELSKKTKVIASDYIENFVQDIQKLVLDNDKNERVHVIQYDIVKKAEELIRISKDNNVQWVIAKQVFQHLTWNQLDFALYTIYKSLPVGWICAFTLESLDKQKKINSTISSKLKETLWQWNFKTTYRWVDINKKRYAKYHDPDVLCDKLIGSEWREILENYAVDFKPEIWDLQQTIIIKKIKEWWYKTYERSIENKIMYKNFLSVVLAALIFLSPVFYSDYKVDKTTRKAEKWLITGIEKDKQLKNIDEMITYIATWP